MIYIYIHTVRTLMDSPNAFWFPPWLWQVIGLTGLLGRDCICQELRDHCEGHHESMAMGHGSKLTQGCTCKGILKARHGFTMFYISHALILAQNQ